jgi:hypothetical protein
MIYQVRNKLWVFVVVSYYFYFSFGQKDHWDVVCAKGVVLYGLYRDVYAYRAAGIETNHHLAGTDYTFFNMTSKEVKRNRNLLRVR